MKKRVIVLLILIVLGVVAGTIYWNNKKPSDLTEPLTLYGNVDIRTAQLAFDGEALVTSMLVEEGAHVQAGDVLARLDSSRLKAELDEASAQVGVQEAAVRRLEAGTRKQEIQQVRARVASREAMLTLAEQNLKRLTQTTASGASSQQRLDDAKAQVSIEQASVNEAREALALAIEGPRLEEIEEARARLEASRAHVRVLEDRLADTELRALSAGTIRSRLLEPGDYATRGRAAYTLAITDPKWVRVYVSEPNLGRVRHGSRAWVTSDSFHGRLFDGWVGFISSVAEFTPKTVETTDLRSQLVYEVRVYVKDPEDRLRMGMPTTVVVDEESRPDASPASAQPSGPPPVEHEKKDER